MTIREAGEKLEQFFLEVIREHRHDLAGTIMKGFLFIASRIYQRAVLFRLWMYDNRVIRNRAIGCLVVSIGNVTCGGTGKTPVVEVFARSLSQQGRKVAILSRGYRSKNLSFWEKIDAKSIKSLYDSGVP